MSDSSVFRNEAIIIPQYITEVKVSDSRRAKYFKLGDKLPSKYENNARFTWKNEKLLDELTKTFVIKNPIAVGKPRYQSIAGNEIYARMHERVRMLIVKAIKANYLPNMPKQLNLSYPIEISMDIHTQPKMLNWDVDNLWIYIKCFQDLLVDLKLIPGDDIRYIKSSGQINFTPVQSEEQRRLIFNITELPKTTHVMYNLEPKVFTFHKTLMHTQDFRLTRTTDGNSGDITADIDARIFHLNVGKRKVSEKAVAKTLNKVYHYCINYNIHGVSVSAPFHMHFMKYLIDELLTKGINVHVHKTTI